MENTLLFAPFFLSGSTSNLTAPDMLTRLLSCPLTTPWFVP